MNHLILFPVVFLYSELLLWIMSPSGFFSNTLFSLLSSLGCGLICTALTISFKPIVNRAISIVLLYFIGIVSALRLLVVIASNGYLTLGAWLTGSAGIITGLGSLLCSTLLHKFFQSFLFFLPALFYTLTGRRRVPARRYPLPLVSLLLVLALLVSGIGIFSAA